MKMADTEKPEELVDSKLQSEEPAEGAAVEAAVGVVEDEPLKTETTSLSEKEIDSPLQMEPGLLSMPCLLTELRRDSPESQPASTESEKPPSSGRACESDSSNPCMLSPSSSGHLADSDTLSSGDEDEERGGSQAQPAGAAEGGNFGSGPGGLVTMGGRKSRRVRSESDASTAKKNRCQPSGGDRQPNGRLAKVKGHRSQKHKERMRLLRQKREAAARKKYNLLQDSSTSDSDLTCESSTSSSDDDDAVSGSSKTITADIPAGFSRADGSSGMSSQIQGLLDSGASWDRNGIGSVLEEAMTRFAAMQRHTEERFRLWMEKLTRLDSDDDSSKDSGGGDKGVGEAEEPVGGRVAPRPSPPSSFLPSSESVETLAAYAIARQSVSTYSEALNNDGPPVIAHYDISDTNSDQEMLNVDSLLAAAVAKELKSFRTQDMGANSCGQRVQLGASSYTDHKETAFAHGDPPASGPLEIKEEINIPSSDSEVEIVGVQENARCIHPRGGVIQSVSSWKHGPVPQYNSTRQPQLWTPVSPQPNWAPPPEVVDLTLDEDARRKYLL
ncbi:hypothetical protein Z043_113424 [Scleropages formosus]|uniref:E3 ubiquitin-protein ligase Arkadia N-terminal domain-containing protein n=1 Tax=Scleropages formosus TaxID=113540 RepID=A0A0P7V4Q2_SCLFO|nr:hypothetical protein Z043_113424 [Scleropages formosus]